MRIMRILSGGDQREVGIALRVVALEHEIADGLELVLVHTDRRGAHALDDGLPPKSERCFADESDLTQDS